MVRIDMGPILTPILIPWDHDNKDVQKQLQQPKTFNKNILRNKRLIRRQQRVKLGQHICNISSESAGHILIKLDIHDFFYQDFHSCTN